MAEVDVEEKLKSMFADVPEGEGRLVVWHDLDGEFALVAETLELSGVEVLIECEGSLFELKRSLNSGLAGRRILLYRQKSDYLNSARLENDWFADIEFYAEHFKADFISMQLSELNAADTPQMRDALSRFKKPLAKKTLVKRVQQLCPELARPEELQLALIAASLGKGVSATSEDVIVSFMALSQRDGAKETAELLARNDLLDALGSLISACAGYVGDVADNHALAAHVLLTALSASVPAACMAGLEDYVSASHAQACRVIVHEWMNKAGWVDELYDTCRMVELDCNVMRHLEACDIEELADADGFPCINEHILHALMEGAAEGTVRFEDVARIVDTRKNLKWFKRVGCYFEALMCYARMQRFRYDHADGFNFSVGRDIFKAYTNDFYRMDTEYRLFHRAFTLCVQNPVGDLEDDVRSLAERAEKLYKGWFLSKLNASWIDAVEADLGTQGYVSDIRRQANFYLDEVDKLQRGKSCGYVIISDALRYEVACELKDRLEQQTKGQAELDAMQSVLPSVTEYGMAALLPHTGIKVNDNGQVTASGLPVATCAQRQEVLRLKDPSAVAVQYTDLLAMRKAQRDELVRDASVVYIYHNSIDAIGDKATTEQKVFNACDEAVEEICGLVKLLVRELRASNIIVTADHGFLYSHDPLEEVDKTSVEEIEGDEPLKIARRYAIVSESSTSYAFVRFDLSPIGYAGATGFAPRECLRIKRPGAGDNYVHGGTSLQEMCIPVLRFKNFRRGSNGYVETTPAQIALLSSTRQVSNSLFRLQFRQTEPVGGKVTPCEYELRMVDASGRAVSDTVKARADMASPVDSQRVMELSFSLKAGLQFPSSGEYFLEARERESKDLAWREQFKIQVAFAPVEDFGW